ncbi:AbiH family protein [Pedobacter sp. Leaf170]|uniref:AbiH family protein n=1 Tax=Pedobacter sp. Leaf170 TaxID=2876558 RepID=UPI001E568EBC|nr:AbiH family protein [Pedobacter sp. Leaf170]
MNRLVIVGNGFDLAHGLKTSYCDFLTNYLISVIDSFNTKFYHGDELIEIKNTYHGTREFNTEWDKSKVFEILKELQSNQYTSVVFKSSLLKDSLQKAHNLKWVDLENDYYEELLRLLQTKPANVDLIQKLNIQFDFLKKKLENYLTSQIVDLQPSEEIQRLFHGPIRTRSMNEPQMNLPNNIMFLNFNYTKTLNNYETYEYPGLTHRRGYATNISINQIHGELKSKENPIIFGFGDEYDEEYVKFESLKTNTVFQHIKSFAYFQTTNYTRLMSFLDMDSFEVYIVGHSCGLSDRTMFREVFGHKNCGLIWNFYYQRPDGTDDFLDKNYELARHFTNKGVMRKKIVAKPFTSPFPQFLLK